MHILLTALAASLILLSNTVSAGIDMREPPNHGLYRKRQAGNTCLPNYMTLDGNDAQAWCPKNQGTLVSAKLPNPTAITAYFIPAGDPTATATSHVIPPDEAMVWFCHCTSILTAGAGQIGTAPAVAQHTGDPGIVDNSKRWLVGRPMRR